MTSVKKRLGGLLKHLGLDPVHPTQEQLRKVDPDLLSRIPPEKQQLVVLLVLSQLPHVRKLHKK